MSVRGKLTINKVKNNLQTLDVVLFTDQYQRQTVGHCHPQTSWTLMLSTLVTVLTLLMTRTSITGHQSTTPAMIRSNSCRTSIRDSLMSELSCTITTEMEDITLERMTGEVIMIQVPIRDQTVIETMSSQSSVSHTVTSILPAGEVVV